MHTRIGLYGLSRLYFAIYMYIIYIYVYNKKYSINSHGFERMEEYKGGFLGKKGNEKMI